MKPEWRERVHKFYQYELDTREPDQCACVTTDGLSCSDVRDIPDSPICSHCHKQGHGDHDFFGIFPIKVGRP